MRLSPSSLAFVLSFIRLLPSSAQVLFDGQQDLPPSEQGWTVVAFPAGAASSSAGAFFFDSQFGGNANRGGLSRMMSTSMNVADGVHLRFNLKVTAEAHANTNRAGVSVILLSDDLRGIELGFWSDRIWAQADSPLFVHAEEAMIPTGVDFVTYDLRFSGNSYELKVGDQTLLAGFLRNYSSFSGFPNVYATQNFIFIGDNTTSAFGTFGLRQVELVSPIPSVPVLFSRRRSDGDLEILWSATPAWELEEAEALEAVTKWNKLIEPPVLNGQTLQVKLSSNATARFFRLRNKTSP